MTKDLDIFIGMKSLMKKISFIGLSFVVSLGFAEKFDDDDMLPIIHGVEGSPFIVQVKSLIEIMDHLGTPFSLTEKEAFNVAINKSDPEEQSESIQKTIDLHCLLSVNINPESRVKVKQGPAKPEFIEKEWRNFLVKVHNEAGVTAALQVQSPNAFSLSESSSKDIRNHWLDIKIFHSQTMKPQLSGRILEYRIIQLYSRDTGKREAKISFDVGQGTQDLGFRSDVDILFDCLKSTKSSSHRHN